MPRVLPKWYNTQNPLWWRVPVTVASLYKSWIHSFHLSSSLFLLSLIFILIHFSSHSPSGLRHTDTWIRIRSRGNRSFCFVCDLGFLIRRFLLAFYFPSFFLFSSFWVRIGGTIWRSNLLLLSWLEIRAKYRRIGFGFWIQSSSSVQT